MHLLWVPHYLDVGREDHPVLREPVGELVHQRHEAEEVRPRAGCVGALLAYSCRRDPP